MNTLSQLLMKKLWGAYAEDRVSIIAPKRITSPLGAIRTSRVMEQMIAMPNATDRWHLWILGAFNKSQYVLPYTDVPAGTWVPIEDTYSGQHTLIETYDQYGVSYPKCDVYYQYTRHQLLLFAIRHRSIIMSDGGLEQLYIKHYHSAYIDHLPEATRLMHIHHLVERPSDRSLIKNQIEAQGIGSYFYWLNGVRINQLIDESVKVGHLLEARFEEGIAGHYYFKLSELPNYYSTIDRCLKWILVPNRLQTDQVTYLDDIEIYVHADVGTQRYGLLYSHNDYDWITQLTPSDFSIVSSRVEQLRSHLSLLLKKPITQDQIVIELIIRTSQQAIPIPIERLRIRDYYRLNIDQRKKVLTGIESTLSYWKADQLEQSLGMRLMNAPSSYLTDANSIEALGYDTVSNALAPSPVILSQNQGMSYCNLGPIPSRDSTIYLYSPEGLLSKVVPSVSRDVFTTDGDYPLAEIIPGLGQINIGDQWLRETDIGTIDTRYSFRVYAKTIINGLEVGNWIDITHDLSYYNLIETSLIFTKTQTPMRYLIRQDHHHYYQEVEIEYQQGQLMHTLMIEVNDVIDTKLIPMPIPFFQYHLWLNGYSLIEGLDYMIQGSIILIMNKSYRNLLGMGKNRLEVRGLGLSDRLDESYPADDIGFVRNNLLSTNQRYNLKEGRNLRVVVGGLFKHPRYWKYEEDDVPIPGMLSLNGKPYAISQLYTPVTIETKQDTLSYIKDTDTIRLAAEDFLSSQKPIEKLPINPIAQKYSVVSPYLSHLTYLLLTGAINPESWELNNRQVIIDQLKPIEHWLSWDQGYLNHYDDRYVQIHPHAEYQPYQITLAMWRVLNEANFWYFQNRVKLNDHYQIQS